MELNLNKNFTDLDGKELNENMGKILAQELSQSNSTQALKFWHWALKLNAGEKLDLDPSDLDILKSFVENHQTLVVFAKAQILGCLK